MKIVFVQNGNYAQAFDRMQAGEAETYRDQYASVRYVADLAQTNDITTIALCDQPHDTILQPGLRSIGVTYPQLTYAHANALLSSMAPDRLVCRTPHPAVLRVAKARRIPTLPCFADLFQTTGLRSAVRNLRLRWLLSTQTMPCVANHSLNASRSVAQALFYPAARIVPWDWSRIPIDHAVKNGPSDPKMVQVFFAGALSAEKGVSDCLEAIRRLHDRGTGIAMSFAGPGDLDAWHAEAARLGLGDSARFLGLIPNIQVQAEMRAADIVVVPSRHSYAEGLPNTIYEALSARTPLILSDHPSFRGRVEAEQACLVFKAADPSALAECLERLCQDTALYARLSRNAAPAVEALYIGLDWPDLINLFLADPGDTSGWVEANGLTALGGSITPTG